MITTTAPIDLTCALSQQAYFIAQVVERVDAGTIFDAAVDQVIALPASELLLTVAEQEIAIRLARQYLIERAAFRSHS